MKLHYYSKAANFGDQINAWLWDRLLPGCMDEDERIRFSGIGTILRGDMPDAEHWIIFTSGVGYPPLPPDFGSKRWNVISVRGPLSAAALGLPSDAAVTDGAVLLACLPEYSPLPENQRSGVVFVPHYWAEEAGNWRCAAEKAGIEYLSPLGESREIIARLRRAKLVLADAMHAAIVADAMRVPWVPLVTSPQVNTFKWLDWTLSMNVPYLPKKLSPTTLASRVQNAMLGVQGERHIFESSDPADALARFRSSHTMRQRAWWPMAKRVGQRLTKEVDRQLRRRYFERWRRMADDTLLERSAMDLAAAARGPSFLSEDPVFRKRLNTLQSRLERVRAAALDPRVTSRQAQISVEVR
jgi:succinoglycan biosynthesis protein ExoV